MKQIFLNSLKLTTTVLVAGLMTAACSETQFTEIPYSPNEGLSQPSLSGKLVTSSEVVNYGNKDVDFLLVLDDSNSMLPELTKLSQKLSEFVLSLESSNINWQMCLTTTRGTNISSVTVYGNSLAWLNYNPSNGKNQVLKRGTANLNSIFTSTIQTLTIGGGLSGDERGTKAVVDHLRKGSSNDCYRTNAALSVILISDEDVRSVGGDASRLKANDASTAYLPLDADDLPETVVSEHQRLRGKDNPFTFSSIIVKPNDPACEADQDKDTSPSHAGYLYNELSNITDGGVGSICEDDYSLTLNAFKDKIVNSLSQFTLECVPLNKKVKLKINGATYTNFKLEKDLVKFSFAIPEGSLVDLEYMCPL